MPASNTERRITTGTGLYPGGELTLGRQAVPTPRAIACLDTFRSPTRFVGLVAAMLILATTSLVAPAKSSDSIAVPCPFPVPDPEIGAEQGSRERETPQKCSV